MRRVYTRTYAHTHARAHNRHTPISALATDTQCCKYLLINPPISSLVLFRYEKQQKGNLEVIFVTDDSTCWVKAVREITYNYYLVFSLAKTCIQYNMFHTCIP